MSRYIDADALEKTLGDWIREHWTEAFTGDDAGSEFADMIDHEEAIDTAQVTHAHWIKSNYDNMDGTIYKCSNCSNESFSAWNYCHCCGAKMDEEAEK